MMDELSLMREIGKNIKDALEDAQMSQRELAEEINMNESTVSRYLKGTTMPTVKNLVNICYVLDCDMSNIVPTYNYIE